MCTAASGFGAWFHEVISLGPSIGPWLSGIGLIATGSAAWITYHYYYRRTRDAAWLNWYLAIYAAFWDDPRVAEVRGWISSDVEYAKIAPILSKRLAVANNTFDAETNAALEKIDYFCSILLRIEFFDRGRWTRRQKKLWYVTFEKYWIAQIRKRTELMAYINEYWGSIFGKT